MTHMNCRRLFACIGMLVMAVARAGTPPPVDLHQRVDFEQLLGAKVPMQTPFVDAHGEPTTLAQIADGKPVLLSLGYYQCPNLCGVMLTAIAQGVAGMELPVGRDFEVVFIGIDPSAGPADTRQTRRTLRQSEPAASVDRWHLLTGDEASIRAVADSIGYRYYYDAQLGQYVHPAGVVVLDGGGSVSQYLFGVGYLPETLRLAIVAASAGKVGNIIDHLVLLCSGYDPQTGQYSVLVGRLLRWLGIVSVLLLGALVYRLHRRAHRNAEGRA